MFLNFVKITLLTCLIVCTAAMCSSTHCALPMGDKITD